jgi:hypothetical protein
MKMLFALTALLALGTVVSTLPAVAPILLASEPAVTAKGDRLDVRRNRLDCSDQVWPNFETACLRVDGVGILVSKARLVGNSRP